MERRRPSAEDRADRRPLGVCLVLFLVLQMAQTGEGAVEGGEVVLLQSGEMGPLEDAVSAGVDAAMASMGDGLGISDGKMASVNAHLPQDMGEATREVQADPSEQKVYVASPKNAAREEDQGENACDQASRLRALGLTTMAESYDADCAAMAHAVQALPSEEPPVTHGRSLSPPRPLGESSAVSKVKSVAKQATKAGVTRHLKKEAALNDVVTQADLQSMKDSMLHDISSLLHPGHGEHSHSGTQSATPLPPQPRGTPMPPMVPPPSPAFRKNPSELSRVESQMATMAAELKNLRGRQGGTRRDQIGSQNWGAYERLNRLERRDSLASQPRPQYRQETMLGASLDSSESMNEMDEERNTLQADILKREARAIAEEKKARAAQLRAGELQKQAQIAKMEAERNERESERLKESAMTEMKADTAKAQSILAAAKAQSAKDIINSHKQVVSVTARAEAEARALTAMAKRKVANLEAAAIKHAQYVINTVKPKKIVDPAKKSQEELDSARAGVQSISSQIHDKLVSLRKQVAEAQTKEKAMGSGLAVRKAKIAAQEREAAADRAAAAKLLAESKATSSALGIKAAKQVEEAKAKAASVLSTTAEKAERMKLEAQHKSQKLLAKAEAKDKQASAQAAATLQSAAIKAKKLEKSALNTAATEQKAAELKLERRKQKRP
jgi:hypothetical protein